MDRQVKIDCLRCSIPLQLTQYITADRGGSAVVPQRTGKQDCRGLRKIIPKGKRAGDKNPRLYCIVIVNAEMFDNFLMKIL